MQKPDSGFHRGTAYAACSLAVFAMQAHASLLINYPTFSSTAGLTLAGNATTSGAVLQLTSAGGGESGAAYSTTAVPLGTSDTFSTTFQFQITNPGGIDPADGITFVLAASPTGLGAAGGDLGYGGVANSVAIELDTYNNGSGDGNSSNHVAIDTSGVLTDTDLTNVYGIQTCDFGSATMYAAPGCLSNGDVWTANVSYNGTALTVSLSDPAEATTFTAINAYLINIASLIGTNTAYVGFTAGTGAGYENQDILNWQLANTAQLPPPNTPEPGTMILLGTGMLGIVVLTRKMSSRLGK